ncbi:serine hydrolase domain-containing protein [Nonomuraea sp. SYSU D8015]|uniref:serine hydrolase domain-containing protein n=1 Tax=Nonomuraea sp. SYSU D8015 TaxID=2593644 RepID=UPI001CB712B4|nr:serine hydrolase domain-containing protein [Nonomuraea sp. SYSU D8015]
MAIGAIAVLTTVTGCAAYVQAQPEEKTFAFAGRTLDVVANGVPTDLVAADREDVKVVRWFDVKSGAKKTSWVLKGNTLTLKAECLGFANCDARFRVEVPRTVRVLRDGRPTKLRGVAAAETTPASASALAGPSPIFHAQLQGGADPIRDRLQSGADAVRDVGVSGVLVDARSGEKRTLVRSGVGDIATRAPVPTDGYFRIGSTTKTFVATVAMQLVGEGKLRLTDTVDRWLPRLVSGPYNDGRKITIRSLLQHTSGLPDFWPDLPIDKVKDERGYRRERFRSYRPEHLVKLAVKRKPDARQGTWRYSATNYVLMGLIIQKVTGHPWEQEVQERILEPLGLRRTLLTGTSPHVPQPRATFYERFSPGGRLADVSVVVDGQADGSMISTTGDLLVFMRALMSGRLLRPAQLAEMRRTVSAEPWRAVYMEAGYGLGIARRRLPCGGWAWFHGGDTWGNSSTNAVSPDGRRAVSISMFTENYGDEDRAFRQAQVAARLADDAMCEQR